MKICFFFQLFFPKSNKIYWKLIKKKWVSKKKNKVDVKNRVWGKKVENKKTKGKIFLWKKNWKKKILLKIFFPCFHERQGRWGWIIQQILVIWKKKELTLKFEHHVSVSAEIKFFLKDKRNKDFVSSHRYFDWHFHMSTAIRKGKTWGHRSPWTP